MARYAELKARGRIEFVTFHQSYSYEDFVEGLRPETEAGEDGANPGGGFHLAPRAGVFRRIAKRAEANKGTAAGRAPGTKSRAFKMSLGRSNDPSEAYLFEECIAGGYVLLGYGGDIDWSDPEFERFDAFKDRWRKVDAEASGNDPNVRQMASFRAAMKVGDIVIIADGNSSFRAIGEVSGPYEFVRREDEFYHRRPVNWLWVNRNGLPVDEIYDRQFMMQSVYSLDGQGLKLDRIEQLVEEGNAATQGGSTPEPYVLVIDEINRANISKVFGELITLIEPDKRLGAENALTVTLPYSGETFGVPANLHVVGTMNTADRSIALLDTALRRRFRFEELMPDPGALAEASTRTGIDLGTVLVRLNERIEYLFDREHQIGHAYFINCATADDVHDVMRHQVLPLLAEYFYEDWEKVARVLGDGGGDGAFIIREKLAAPNHGGDDYGEQRYRYSVRGSFAGDCYARLTDA
jgi:5-methylcytosine-specific restriction protein B